MTIEEQIELVNKWFEDGRSKQEIENELGMKYDNWRKRVYRKGYRFNKELNQWLLDNTNIGDDITPTNTCVCDDITQENTNMCDDVTPENTKACDDITRYNIKSCDDITLSNTYICDDIIQADAQFSLDDVQVLKKLISNYKTSESINDMQMDDDDILARSVRVYKNQFDRFAKYCRDNNINQAKALAKAIDYILENE